MRQIIALGGGGFLRQPDNTLLEEYILRQSGKEEPKICYLPTASGDPDIRISAFYDFYKNLKCVPSHLSLFKPSTRDIEGFIFDKDIIYVGGGNTKNLLVLWKEWGLDTVLKKAWEQGIVMSGVSAGSLCWFEEGVTDSFGIGLDYLTCLGFLKGSNCPHYDSEKDRRPVYHQLIGEGKIKPGIAAEDGVALHYKDLELSRVVSSRPFARAYKVFFNTEVSEKILEADYLG